MAPSPTPRVRAVIWIVTILLPVAAWISSGFSWSFFHPGIGAFFVAAGCLSAAIGGLRVALAAIVLNGAALNAFIYLQQLSSQRANAALWTALLVAVTLIVGYAREKWSAAEMLAGRLSTDLARLRDELESQRTDLKRFHDLSVRLSSSLELQRLLNDVLTSVASLQKTDLAMLLVLPEPSSKRLRVETFIGFTAEQIRLFGELPADFFSLEHRVLVEDIEHRGTYFPFMDAAEKVGLRAVFSTPIINVRGEPLGVVATFFRQPNAPSERQSRLVELYARQAANALDNARLYRNSLDTLAAEQQRTALLRSLAEAAVQINSTLALDSLLQAITDQARSIIGARQAFTTLLPRGAWHNSITCVSTAEGQPAMDFPRETSEIFMLACNLNTPLRLGSSAKEDRPWRSLMVKASEATSSGWLAAPLLTRDGRNLGLIQLSRKINGEFSSDDEAILVQLAHMASVAIDNVRLYREAQEQIGENKRTQEALERSKESMQLAQQYVGIGIWEWDLQTGALVWSEQLRRLHGFSGEFDGKYESWMESIHAEDRQQVHRAITDAMAHNGEYEVQYRVVFPDKSVHWLEARGRTIVIAGTAVRMLGVAMDISSRKSAEEALRQSEKLAATGHLAASIAHEINNPLAAVTNALYILRTTTGMPANAVEYVRTAELELSRVVHITRQTLGFYREIASPVLVQVPKLLDEALAAFDSKIETNQVTVHRRYGNVGPLSAFPAELRQVFSNLTMNALEAVGENGHVSVRARYAHDRENMLGLRITVADNGAGIAPENMPHIFEPFFTTKDSKGTGLGLWVSQGIVQKHGGRIRVRSSQHPQHHGTCFVIFLPMAAQAVSAVASVSLRAAEAGTTRQAAASGNDLSAA
ncbi:MAG TPA: ATP-binding protein [Candidatus Angelobacter sp.]|nr:ATP-binding protein [Candidatus Angelobacter sp.]